MTDANCMSTPIECDCDDNMFEKSLHYAPYREAVDILMFSQIVSGPYINFVVNVVPRVLENPISTNPLIGLVKQILGRLMM